MKMLERLPHAGVQPGGFESPWCQTSLSAGCFPVAANFDKEFNRLTRTLDEATKRHWRLATVNLLVEHNVPVTFRNGGDVASAR